VLIGDVFFKPMATTIKRSGLLAPSVKKKIAVHTGCDKSSPGILPSNQT
jgi:hypothetical protein